MQFQRIIKYSYIYLFTAVIAALFFISCEEIIDLELNDPDNQRIVVEGRITNEMAHHQIRLSRTLSYFANEPAPPMLEAEAYILEEGTGEQYPLELIDDTIGMYQTGLMAAKVGETYTLHINDNGETYQASDYLDTIPTIDSVNYEYTVYQFFGVRVGIYLMKFSLYEPPPAGHIYRIDVFLNDTLYTEELADAIYFDDFQTNDMYWADIEFYGFPQEDITLDTNSVRFEMYSISEEEFDFLIAFFSESFGNGSIFSGPPANIPTNIINTSDGIDGLGFFGASGKTVFETTIIKEHSEDTNNPF